MKPARAVLLLAAAAALLLLVAGPGSRFGVWHFRTGFLLMRWAAFAGLAAAALAVLLAFLPRVRRGHVAALALAFLVGLAVAYVPWSGMRKAQQVPPIHDITTDTADPPAFVAVLPLRAEAPNAAVYEGEAVAAQQRAGYPALGPVQLPAPPAEVFARALAAAQDMGWEIVASDPAAGRIEATDTTRWFGFKDDIVVRVRAEGGGSRVDVRSVSRVGKSDVGTNAARIQRFLVRLTPSRER